jgi:hypothetical protein
MEGYFVLSKKAKIKILKNINLDKKFIHKFIANKNGSFICSTVKKNKKNKKEE